MLFVFLFMSHFLFFCHSFHLVAMFGLVQHSSSSSTRTSAGRDSLPARYWPLHDIRTYIGVYRRYFVTIYFLMVPSEGSPVFVPVESAVRYYAAWASWERYEHCKGAGGGVSHLLPVCQEINSQFIRFRRENENQKKLGNFLAETCHHSKVPSVVATNLLAWLETIVGCMLSPVGPIVDDSFILRHVCRSARVVRGMT